jgi:hypothetical protein
MKRKVWLSSALILVTGLLISCTKTNPGAGSTAVNVQSSMSATINGTSWVATSFSGTNVSGTLVLEGGKSDGSQFTLDIPTSTGNGAHKAGGINSCQATFQTGTTYSSMTTGTVTINSNSNNVISGTFSGTFTNQSTQAVSTITNGVFTSTYQ